MAAGVKSEQSGIPGGSRPLEGEIGRAQHEFLATLAHELRQPLAAAFAALEVQRRSLSPERRQRAGEVLEKQLHHLASLVRDISDVSRINLGTLELALEPLDLRGLIEEAVEMALPAIDERRQELTLSLGTEPVAMTVDRTRMKQVVSNLLQNASAYTPPGGHLEVSLEGYDGLARIRVRDDGQGVAAADRERIFEIFQRGGDGAATGLGIGLALVKRLVELHGGTVSVNSDGAGCGSEFVVSLPLAPGAAE